MAFQTKILLAAFLAVGSLAHAGRAPASASDAQAVGFQATKAKANRAPANTESPNGDAAPDPELNKADSISEGGICPENCPRGGPYSNPANITKIDTRNIAL